MNGRLKALEKGSLRHAHRFVVSRLNRLSGVKRQVYGWVILLTLLIGVSVLQWTFARDSYSTTDYVSGGSYSEAVLGPLETLNPIFARSSAERSAAKLLFASLYSYDQTGSIKADLAEKIVVSPDETEYFVTIKKGIKWSDGRDLTATDVVFTVGLLSNPATNTEIVGWRSIKAAKIDEQTIKFKLPVAYAPFKHALTFPVLPEHILKDVEPSELRENSFGSSPVTSGAFTFRTTENVVADGSKKVVYLAANKKYHKGAPKLDRFQLYVYPSQDDIAKSLRIKQVTATSELTYDTQPDEVKSAYSLQRHTVNNGVYALFNMGSQYLQSKSIRQALSLSINVAKLRQSNNASAAGLNGPVLDRFLSKKTSLPEYNVEKAKQLLEAEGWKVGADGRQKNGELLAISVVVLKDSSYEKIAKKITEEWTSKLNIKADVSVVDANDPSQNILQSVLQPRNFDVLIYELALGGDPDIYAYWHSSQATSTGLNFANYNNSTADLAIDSARSKLSMKQRTERYDKFVSVWLQDMPAIPLYQSGIEYIQLRSARALNEKNQLVSAVDRYGDVQYWAVNKTSVYKTP